MTVDSLLNTILGSVKSTTESLAQLETKLREEDTPTEGISLLSLKNSSLLAYINAISLYVLQRLDALDGEADLDAINEIVKRSIEQRVVLERGVKPLEKKLGYQIDKLTRSYMRMEKELEQKQQEQAREAGSDSDSESEEEDAFNFRPKVSNFVQQTEAQEEAEAEEEDDKKYRPPKISAVLPPTETRPERHSRQKLQSMEEYLDEMGDAPMLETSIGSTILEHGRGVKTFKDLEKEREITKYEEENFTRLPENVHKKQQKLNKRKNNIFAGEDWSMFGNEREFKTKKVRNSWERAKRRKL